VKAISLVLEVVKSLWPEAKCSMPRCMHCWVTSRVTYSKLQPYTITQKQDLCVTFSSEIRRHGEN